MLGLNFYPIKAGEKFAFQSFGNSDVFLELRIGGCSAGETEKRERERQRDREGERRAHKRTKL
jgi:hypothetical protein